MSRTVSSSASTSSAPLTTNLPGMTTPASETPVVEAAPTAVVEPTAPIVETPTTEPVAEPAPEPAAEETPDEPAKWEAEADWQYDWLEDFKGDRLAIRIPTGATLNAWNMAQGKRTSNERRADLIRMIFENHLSEASYERVFVERSVDPDDPEYGITTSADLLNALFELAGDRVVADAEALKKVAK